MGPQNGIVGDGFGIDLPVSKVDERELSVEKNLAKFSKTAEYKRLKSHLEQRIAFYQQYLPDGRSVGGSMPTPEQWQAANIVIGEIRSIITSYENAREAVDAVQR